MKSSPCLARAGWEPSTARETRSSAATSPSRSSPQAFIADADRRARFEREARLLAALNHPHVGAIYGFEERDGICALILELIEGQTLAQRSSVGPAAAAGSPRNRAADCGCARGSARTRNRASRSETGECHPPGSARHNRHRKEDALRACSAAPTATANANVERILLAASGRRRDGESGRLRAGKNGRRRLGSRPDAFAHDHYRWDE